MLALHSAHFHRMTGPTRLGSELSDAFGPFRGVIPACRESADRPGATDAHVPPNSGLVKTEIGMFRTGSWLPGQFGLVECPAMDVFQEVGIGLVGDSGS